MAGIIVMRRRQKMLNLIFRKPSIMTCPAIVPTVEEESPEQRRATAKAVADRPPNKGRNVSWACSMVITGRPARKKTAAALTIMAEVTSQAPVLDAHTTLST